MTSPSAIRETIVMLRQRVAEIDRLIEKIQYERNCVHEVARKTRAKD
jgi:hypothetical protein